MPVFEGLARLLTIYILYLPKLLFIIFPHRVSSPAGMGARARSSVMDWLTGAAVAIALDDGHSDGRTSKPVASVRTSALPQQQKMKLLSDQGNAKRRPCLLG